MDLKISDSLFIVTGASSGLGRAVADSLLDNKASVIAVARREDSLMEILEKYPDGVEIIIGDILEEDTINKIIAKLGGRKLSGVFVNAGGPPAMSFEETQMANWDDAYHLLIRWKVYLVKKLIPFFREQKYGRILFSESATIKQPIENLVLSNSLRMAIAGIAKTLSLELADAGITVNVIGPGFHETSAIDRLFNKKSELEGISFDEARAKTTEQIPMGKIGNPADFASLAVWLLSPLSGFVSGQVISVDGGATLYSLG